MYNLIEYSNDYSNKSIILWHYCRDERALNVANGNIKANATTKLFKIKEKIIGKTGNRGKKDMEIMVPLKYLRNFWRTLKIFLIICECNLHLNWSKKLRYSGYHCSKSRCNCLSN